MSELVIHCHNKFSDINLSSYEDLWIENGEPAFYHPNFLIAAERHPILPIRGVSYLSAWEGKHLLAFLVVYEQSPPDPYGTLARCIGGNFSSETRGLVGHIPLSYDTQILQRSGAAYAVSTLLNTLINLAKNKGTEYCGLLSIFKGKLLQTACQAGYKIRFMNNCFHIDLSSFNQFDNYIATLSRYGRKEIKRQLSKFKTSEGSIRVLPLLEANLGRIVELCRQTSARYGTPYYYPQKIFHDFLTLCGNLITVVQVEQNHNVIAGMICLREPSCLHLWAGGVDYTQSSYSPYCIMVSSAIQYAITQGFLRVEGGRNNAHVKTRLGFTSQALYSAIRSL